MRLAVALRRRGLATPALIMVEMLTPVGPVAGDVVKTLGPLIPFRQWHRSATTLAGTLGHSPSRDLLLQLLENDR